MSSVHDINDPNAFRGASGQRTQGPINRANGIQRPETPTAQPPAGRGADKLDLSDDALRRADAASAASADRVDSIRSALDRGDYPLEANLDTALDRLLNDAERWFA